MVKPTKTALYHHLVRQFPDYPKPGVVFQDISAILASPKDCNELIEEMAKPFQQGLQVDLVAGLEARDLVLGGMIAQKLGAGFVAIRKANGKLPGPCVSQSYDTEYGSDAIKVSKDAIRAGQRVLLVDDLLATGGTAQAGCRLVQEQLGATVVGCTFAIVLEGLTTKSLPGLVHAAMRFDAKTGEPIPIREEEKKWKAPKPVRLPVYRDATHQHDARSIVLYYPTMKRMANNLVTRNSQKYRLGAVDWNRFPDGTPNIQFEHQKNLEGRDVILFMDMRSLANFMEQLFLAMVLPKQNVRSLELIIPYFSVGTHERVQIEGILASADPASKLLTQGLPATQKGPVKITIVDIHALGNRFYFSNEGHVNFVSAFPLFKRQIRELFGNAPVIMATTDDGCWKRYGAMIKHEFPVLIFNKVREGDKRIMKLKDNFLPSSDYPFLENDGTIPAGAHVIIIDDLINSGGTMYECGKALKAMGATKISCFAIHAVFPNRCYLQFLPGAKMGDIFERILVTDTVPEITEELEKLGAPFKVLPVAEQFCPAVPAHYVTTCLVASESEIKLAAATRALGSDIWGIRVSSGVHEQPLGAYETWKGAMNRLYNALEKDQGKSYRVVVAMENGILNTTHECEDVGCVAYFSRKTQRTTIQWTKRVPLPPNAFNGWLQELPKYKTFGEYLKATNPQVSSANNWQLDLYGANMDRVVLLADALVAAQVENGAYQI